MAIEEHGVNIKRVVLVIITALILISLILPVVQGATESRAAQGSAQRLANAIDNVYSQKYEFNNSNHAEPVEILLPQDIGWWSRNFDNYFTADPKWIIYSHYDPEDIEAVYYKADLVNPRMPPFCNNLCVGFVEKTDTKEILLKGNERTHPFWILSPCKATVNVYYDDSIDKVRIGFIESLDDDEANFCCNDNEGYEDGDWPLEGQAFDHRCDFN